MSNPPHQLTADEQAWVDQQVAKLPPLSDDQALKLALRFMPKPKDQEHQRSA